jgi:hypothetical protein
LLGAEEGARAVGTSNGDIVDSNSGDTCRVRHKLLEGAGVGLKPDNHCGRVPSPEKQHRKADIAPEVKYD